MWMRRAARSFPVPRSPRMRTFPSATASLAIAALVSVVALRIAEKMVDVGSLLREKIGDDFFPLKNGELLAHRSPCQPLRQQAEKAFIQFREGRYQFQEDFLAKFGEMNIGQGLHIGGARFSGQERHLAEDLTFSLRREGVLDPLVVYERYGYRPAEDHEHGVSGVTPVENAGPGGKAFFGQTGDNAGKGFRGEILENPYAQKVFNGNHMTASKTVCGFGS